ncbi:hypothetical protein ScPMuIL_017378 [Solemya velum]
MLVHEEPHRKSHSLSGAMADEVSDNAIEDNGYSNAGNVSPLWSQTSQRNTAEKPPGEQAAVMRRTSVPKESSPNRSKSRTEKFHKLFKSVPEEEYPIDSFICAYQSDILLQGCLYISQSWFCFYSKIRARRRLLEIPLEKVIAITREKTALIIPNAIGIQTAEEKYVFGSFVSRDTAYKLLMSMWRTSQDTIFKRWTEPQNESGREEPNCAEQSGDQDETLSVTMSDSNRGDECFDSQATDHENNNVSPLSQSETNQNKDTESDISVCLECGSVEASDNSENLQGFRVKEKYIPKFVCENKTKMDKPSSKGIGTGLFFMQSLEHKKICGAFSQLSLKLQSLPRTNLLLAICIAMIVFLVISAFGLTYKVLLLQARLDARDVWTLPVKHNYRDKIYSEMYGLHSVNHIATIKQLHTVLQANIDALEQISTNLKGLQDWTAESEHCQNDNCS